jgi:hypothetical protein
VGPIDGRDRVHGPWSIAWQVGNPAGRVLQDFAFRDPTAATTIYNRVRPHPTSGREIALRFVLLRLQSASPKNPRTLPGGTLPPPTSWRRRLWQAGSEGRRPSSMTPSPSPATCRACRRSAAGARRRLLPPTSASASRWSSTRSRHSISSSRARIGRCVDARLTIKFRT